jgi:hypothetical protein
MRDREVHGKNSGSAGFDLMVYITDIYRLVKFHMPMHLSLCLWTSSQNLSFRRWRLYKVVETWCALMQHFNVKQSLHAILRVVLCTVGEGVCHKMQVVVADDAL